MQGELDFYSRFLELCVGRVGGRRRLLKLFLKIGELLAQGKQFPFQFRDLLFEYLDPLVVQLGVSWFSCRRRTIIVRNRRRHRIAGEQVHVAGFFGAGFTRQNFDHRRFPAGKEIQGRVHGLKILERIHTFRARAQFAGSLRSTEKQNAQHRDFMAVKIVELIEPVLILGDARIAPCGTRQRLIGERAKSVANSILFKGHDRFAIRFLIAGVQERIKREWIVFGSGDFFFDQRSKNAHFDIRELQIHAQNNNSGEEARKKR